MKSLVVLLCLFILSGCGLSEGDEVIVLPNDKLERSASFTGKVARIDDSKITVSNSEGTLLTFSTTEVFPADDKEAQAIAIARKDFFKTFEKNAQAYGKEVGIAYKDSGNSSIGEVLLDKAKEAQLPEWVAYFELKKKILALLRRYANVDGVSRRKLAEEMVGFLDDDELKELELAINKLSDSSSAHELASHVIGLFQNVAENSITLISNPKSHDRHYGLLRSIKNQDDEQFTTNAFNRKESIKPAIENTMVYIDLLVKSKQHILLMSGQQPSNQELTALRLKTMDKLYNAAFPAALRFAREELESSIPSVELAEKVIDIIGFQKEDLARIHKNASWDELLSEIKAAELWQTNFIDDGWQGSIDIPKTRYGPSRVLDSKLSLFISPTSLYDLKARLRADSYSGNINLNGEVSYDSEKIIITDALGNWKWSSTINDKGELIAKGQVPFRRRLYDVNVTFNSPEIIARKERERQAKIEEFNLALKKEPWYGVVFQDNQPTGTLIKLDFNKTLVQFLDITSDQVKGDTTKFSYAIDESGRGTIKENKGAKIPTWHPFDSWRLLGNKKPLWHSGNKWDFVLSDNGENLEAGFSTKKIILNKVYHINYTRESLYKQMLEDLASIRSLSFKAGRLNPKTVKGTPDKWTEKIVVQSAKVDNSRVILESAYSNDNQQALSVKNFLVPEINGSSIIYFNLPKNRDAFLLKKGITEVGSLAYRERGYERIIEKGDDVKVTSQPTITNSAKIENAVKKEAKPYVGASKPDASQNNESTFAVSKAPAEPTPQKESRQESYELALNYVKKQRLSRRASGESALDLLDVLEESHNPNDHYEESLKTAIITKYLDLADNNIDENKLNKGRALISKAQNVAHTDRAIALQNKLNSKVVPTQVRTTQVQKRDVASETIEALEATVNKGAETIGGFLNGLINK